MLTWLTKNTLMKILVVGVSAAVHAYALDLFTVSGECQVTEHGLLRVYLVDERSFPVPMSGIQTVTRAVAASGTGKQRIAFTFSVPRGTYGIRCFLDVNGNGALDRGLLGPLEPWDMSWRNQRPAGFPRFADIAFTVSGDCRCPLLVIR
jgi:uncharacterized protein (DUF2141 family)